MNQVNWLDIFNSATTFGVLTVIAVGVLLLLARSINSSKSPKRK